MSIPGPCDAPPEPLPPRRQAAAWALLAATAWAAALLVTAPATPMTWDEGNAILRAEGIARWAGRWLDRSLDRRGPLDREVIAEDWHYTTQLEGHPPVYGIVIAAGRAVAPPWLGPRERARFGPLLLFAAAVGAVVYRLVRERSALAALAAAVAMLLLPRLFAHAHFASFDGPLVALWLAVWAAFAAARTHPAAAAGWGMLLGLLLASKATGWFALLPLVAWTGLYRDRPALRAMALGLPAAALTFWLVNPPLWHAPLDGIRNFFVLNFDRAAQPGLNISTQFFGRMYNLDRPLPWYNTLVWTAITVPLPILACFAAALLLVARRWRAWPAGMLLAMNWAVLVLVRALPGTPPHDAERLFLPSFAFLAILAGIGFAALWSRLALRKSAKHQRRSAASQGPSGDETCSLSQRERAAAFARACTHPSALRLLVLLIVLGTARNLVVFAPQWLSYYSLPIGGLRGAVATGMEPTYYWDALDGEALDWLHAHTGEDEKIRFAAPAWENLVLMHHWRLLRRDFRPAAPGRFRWYVVQHRPSAWRAVDRHLLAHAHPAYQTTVSSGWGPWRREIPLLSVFAYSDYLDARHATGLP